MARKRTISQSIALLTGPTPATGAHGSNLDTIWGVQSANLSWENPKEDIQVFGLGAPIGRETVNPPNVNLSFSYLITSNINEKFNLNFNCNGTTSALSNILAGEDERNYFMFVAPEGSDAVGLSGSSAGVGVIGIGNGFLSSYSVEGAVGGFPTASVEVQGLNWKQYTSGTNCYIPAVNPTTGLEITDYTFSIPTILNDYTYTGYNLTGGIGYITGTVAKVLKPGDITVSLANAGGIFYDYNTICAQSFRMSFDLNRNTQNCLGSRFTTSRDISFPINVDFEVEMIAKDIKTGSLANYLCDTGSYSASVRMTLPTCGSTAGSGAYGFKLNNISLERQELTTSVGSESQILRTSWKGQIGGSGDTNNGFFFSGSFI